MYKVISRITSGGGGVTLQSFVGGGPAPRTNPSPFYLPSLPKKGKPFGIHGTPFTYIPKNTGMKSMNNTTEEHQALPEEMLTRKNKYVLLSSCSS